MKFALGILVLALLVAVAWSFATFLEEGYERADREERFEGACEVLGGAVHDDVCVKDDRVVLRLREMKK